MAKIFNQAVLDEIITGRVEPHIYAFKTNTIPNYLKVGDTYRAVSVRLKEWEAHYPNLEKTFEGEAKIEGVYFRDFSVHDFLESEKHKLRLLPSDLPSGIYYSKEFFKDTDADDVREAIVDIQADYKNKTQKYQFYSTETLKPEETVFPRTETYPMRPNQENTVKAFRKATDNGRKNLLMYAVMRFGKSFTSMCCAVEMGAKLVVVVSAKADVKAEWKKTVESHVKFDGYEFVTADTLSHNNHTITERLNARKKVAVFLTLQDLQGEQIKDKHQEVFGRDIDLLLVDETHFGARAEKYGEVLKNANNYESDVKNKKDRDDFVDVDEADKTIKTLKANITIHLSGTPYRILMGSEFKKEDIIAFYQFTDIVDEQKAWDNEHILDDECKEWDNPYYGFPQMVRFAFRPNESSRKRLEELRKVGMTYAFSALFKPQSIKKADEGAHKKFIYEREILDLLEVIDGSKSDDELLGFLDYDKLKEGKMCRHIVIVLPYCASCDALEELIKTNKDKFRNLNGYEIVNISGVDKPNAYKSPKEIKTTITKHEENGKKTITLTVNRMLTGSTVPEWDTMLYLKDTASPQEYDQAVFRLQNQYVKTFKDATTGKTIKFNMKPQTLLVDFDPNRMFVMQEKKSKIYNANVDTGGNSELEKRIRKELEISPIIAINKDKIERVVATDILEAVSNYQKDKGIKDEALEIPVDLSILDDSTIRAVIELENEIGSKSGLSVPAHDGEDDDGGSELDVPETQSGDDTDEETPTTNTTPTSVDDKCKQEISLTKKVQSYYTRILLFAFITKDTVISLSDIIARMETEENGRIAKNLGLSKQILTLLNQKTNKFVLSDLDYKIQDLNILSRATDLAPAERANVAVNKFGKLGDAIVITPSNICDDMVNLLPEEFIKSLPTTNGKVLDIAGTAGEFAVALHKRMTELGLEKDFIANAIYTIPKSSICYELTRKLYEMLELNVQNIAKEFIATDMLDVKIGEEIDYDKIKALLTQNKPFNTIKLTDTLAEGETEMLKFEAVVGNPPYQEDTSGDSTGTNPIYHYFVDISQKLSSLNVIITPARFLFNAGKTPKAWNKRMLEDKHFKVAFYKQNPEKVFEGIPITGGVAISCWNKNEVYQPIGIFIPYEELQTIIAKVKQAEDFSSITNIIYVHSKFDLEKIYSVNSSYKNLVGSEGRDRRVRANAFEVFNFFTETPQKSTDIRVLGLYQNKRTYRYVNEQYLENCEWINKYKVFVPESNGASGMLGDEAARIISRPAMGVPNDGVTQTFIVVGAFDTQVEADNLHKYILSKFCRLLLGSLKATQRNNSSTWANVPLQDFTANSDIDWSKSIPEIDKQLYAKYGLIDEEIQFIEKMIKPME
ncbi:MAG: Eco57I restriction-modification methylase domain-containing protein [Campylobacter sp.]|nr:Eco57I restriction-modification methylase domain-containing protein [Campylobacter sp.]